MFVLYVNKLNFIIARYLREIKSKQLLKRELSLHKYVENRDAIFRSIAKSLKINESTVGRVIKRYLQTSSLERKPGSGRKPAPDTREVARKIDKSLRQNPSLSIRDLSAKCGTARQNVFSLKKKMGYKNPKCRLAPHRSDAQNIRAKKRAL